MCRLDQMVLYLAVQVVVEMAINSFGEKRRFDELENGFKLRHCRILVQRPHSAKGED